MLMCGVWYLVILVILLLVPSICITVLSPGRNSSVCPAVSTAATFSGVSSSSSWSDSVMYGRLPSSPEQSYILQMVKVATVPCVPGLGGPALPGRLSAMLMTGSCWPGAPTQGARARVCRPGPPPPAWPGYTAWRSAPPGWTPAVTAQSYLPFNRGEICLQLLA